MCLTAPTVPLIGVNLSEDAAVSVFESIYSQMSIADYVFGFCGDGETAKIFVEEEVVCVQEKGVKRC